jgi:hypothetical protein
VSGGYPRMIKKITTYGVNLLHLPFLVELSVGSNIVVGAVVEYMMLSTMTSKLLLDINLEQMPWI